MKIAINLVGIAGEMPDHARGMHGGRNWYNTKDFVKNKIIDCWLPSNTIEVYFTAYTLADISSMNSLVEFFNPQKYKFIDFVYNVTTQRTTYIESLKSLIDCDADFVIITRFDIEFFKKINELNIDLNKVNFLFKENVEKHLEYACDTLCIVPMNYLKPFINAVEMLSIIENDQHIHGTYRELKKLIGDNAIHFVSNELYYSYNGGNPFYYLHRPNGVHELNREHIKL